MSNRQTDLDLVNVFDHQMKTSLHEEYNQALSMLRVAPSYTLLDFRKILETICLTLAHKSDIEFCNDNLRQNIDHLHTTQIIDHQLNDICHQLRSLCNTGSHIREKDNKLRTNLENNANKARDFLIEIMQHILSFEFNISKFNNVSLVDNPSQERKELLYQSLEGKKPAQYFKVGQFYEGLAYDVQADKDGTNNQAIAVSYFSIAAEHYKLACRLSAKQSQANNVVSTIEKSAQTCLLDPLVSYARLLHVEQIEENISDLSIKLFSIAANRNNPLAQVVMGFNCYENKKYRQASKLFHKAEKQQHPLAYKGLFFIYHKSQTKMVDDKKAYFYLKKGIALDCIDCKAELGYAMYKGNLIPQNQNEGKRLIEMSAKLGSVEGFKYMCEMLIDELPI